MTRDPLHAVVSSLDTTWETFDEVASYCRLPRRQVAALLRVAKARGLADSRRSDAHGRVEYAVTPEGDRFAGRV